MTSTNKVAILTDTHCGIHNSSEYFIQKQEEFYRDLFFPTLEKYQIDTIYHLGDYFDDRKKINIRAFDSNKRSFLDVCKDKDIFLRILVGNHDAFYKNTIEVNSLTALLSEYPNVDVISKPTTYEGITYIPWICENNYEETLKVISSSDASLCLGHFELSGFNMYPGIDSKSGTIDLKLLNKFDSVLSGHYHTKSQKDNITYLGTSMEFTAGDTHDPKYFHILDLSDNSLIPIQNKNTIFEKCIYSESLLTANLSTFKDKILKLYVPQNIDLQIYQKVIDKFNYYVHELRVTEILSSSDENETSVVSNDENFENTLRHVSTLDIMKEYSENLETSLDKKKIYSIYQKIHKESSQYVDD